MSDEHRPTPREVLELVLLYFEGRSGADGGRWEEILPGEPASRETLVAAVRDVLETTPEMDGDLDAEDLMRAAQADGYSTHVTVFAREYDGERSRLLLRTLSNCEDPRELAEALWLALERLAGQI